jgi:hypothetical protein
MNRYPRKRKDGQLTNWDLHIQKYPDDRRICSWELFWSLFRQWLLYWWTFLKLSRLMKEHRLTRRSISLKCWRMTPEEERQFYAEAVERFEEGMAKARAEPEKDFKTSMREWDEARASRTRLRKIADWCQDWKRILKLWLFPYADP